MTGFLGIRGTGMRAPPIKENGSPVPGWVAATHAPSFPSVAQPRPSLPPYRLNIEEMAQQVGPVQAALWATEYAADHFPLALNTLAQGGALSTGNNLWNTRRFQPVERGKGWQTSS